MHVHGDAQCDNSDRRQLIEALTDAGEVLDGLTYRDGD
jgi:hypothetical protein